MRTKFFALLILGVCAAVRVGAIPTLQLDIAGGVYDPATQTTVSTGPIFDLRALLNGTLDSSRTYYISAAVAPGLGQTNPPPAFGSVLIDGVSYSPGNFLYGTPPADVSDGGQGNLAPHDIFPTYYLEFAFNFDSLHTVGKYNTQDGSLAPGILYYHDFDIDVTGLLPGYVLHFDLYDEAIKKKTGLPVIDDFAPFSHDAESGHQVPDRGSTLWLFASSLVGLGLAVLAQRTLQSIRVTQSVR